MRRHQLTGLLWLGLGICSVLPVALSLLALPARAQAPQDSGLSYSTAAPLDDEGREERPEGGQGDRAEQNEDEAHDGFLSRISLGIGYGLYSGKGQIGPIPGVEVIRDPSHGGPALNVSLDWGFAIIENLALHIGVTFETLLTSDDESSIGGFYFFGLGGGVSYYFMPYDLYLTGRLRWAGVLLYLPDAPCDFLGTDKLEGYGGIGLSLAFGKEWFSDGDDVGFGVGLQINYAYLGGTPAIHYFSAMVAPTITSF